MVELSILIGVDCGGADCAVLGGVVVGADESGTVVAGGVAGIESMVVDLSRLSVEAAAGSLAYQPAFSVHQLVEVGCHM